MNISATSNSPSLDEGFYLYTQLATGISLLILSPITVISNLLLLLTIYKDPLKCFRTPASYLIIALGCVDFTTGLVIEPLFVAYRLASYLKWSLYPGRSYESLLRIGSSISTVGLNLSFLLVLALIWTQFLAITHPQRYRSAITTRRILVFVGVSTLYIHRSPPKKPPSDRSPFPCHSHNNPAFRRFWYTSEVTSPISQRISPKWRRWRLETTYGGNFVSISNTNSFHTCSLHYT